MPELFQTRHDKEDQSPQGDPQVLVTSRRWSLTPVKVLSMSLGSPGRILRGIPKVGNMSFPEPTLAGMDEPLAL